MNAKEAFAFLQEKLSVTTFQAIIFAMLIDHVTPLQPRQMAAFLGTSIIRVLSLMSELNELVDRRLVRTHLDRVEHENVFEILREVLLLICRIKL